VPQEREPLDVRKTERKRDSAPPTAGNGARRATGITNHPRGEEASEQTHLPPRGAKKGESATEDEDEEAQEDEDPLEATALQELIRELEAERDRRLAEFGRRESDARSLSRDLDEPRDTADEAMIEQNTDRVEFLAKVAADRVDSLQRALDRVAQGRLLICDRCGGKISIARLRANPQVSTCITCARELEASA